MDHPKAALTEVMAKWKTQCGQKYSNKSLHITNVRQAPGGHFSPPILFSTTRGRVEHRICAYSRRQGQVRRAVRQAQSKCSWLPAFWAPEAEARRPRSTSYGNFMRAFPLCPCHSHQVPLTSSLQVMSLLLSLKMFSIKGYRANQLHRIIKEWNSMKWSFSVSEN